MLLGIDLGTTSIKAVVAEPTGRVVARAAGPANVHYGAHNAVEQDLEDIAQATLRAIAGAGEQIDLSAVQAIGVSAQGGAMQVIDADESPVGPVISWMDGRGAPYDARFTEQYGHDWFAEHIGHGRSAMSIGQVTRLRAEQPDLITPERGIGWVGDLIVSRLCGRRAHDGTSLALTMFHNPVLKAADPDVLKLLDLNESQLPDLIGPRQTAGELSDAIAQQTGLPAGIPVSAAIHDQYCSDLGCGAANIGDMMLGTGTAWVLLATTQDRPALATPQAFCCTHVVDGRWGQMLSMVNGGSAFDWARRMMGLDDHTGAALDALMSDVTAGCAGARFWPLLTGIGAAGLAPGTAGRLTGLDLSHTRGHVLRAVVEGLACELGRYLKMLTDAGVNVQRLVMGGGAAASSVTPQVLANVTALPLSCTAEPDMSALGAAIIARGLIEPDAPLDALSRQMATDVRTVEPNDDAVAHQQVFEEYLASIPWAVEEG